MSIVNIGEALLGVALLVWIVYRQMTWTAVDVGRMWRMPAILGLVGVVTLVSSGSTKALTAVDLGLLALELAVAVVTGALMGFVATFRPITEKGLAAWRARRRPGDAAEPTTESRTGWIGLVLWIVMVAVRVGLGFWGHSLGSALAESSGVILLVLAVNRGLRTLVFSLRHDRHLSLAAR
ncbi:hypothetical protein GCM10009840_11780 [Pseudolysinimonas kribbensis]|jgi:hypothetical protein|uniref:DUF1453 domain-containing protein n=1 Tax=Pseudolysinimonas kribbensis TaxID=433641 RepID=A0ABQ6K8J5_9MICO|nr:hypothetical protein [Pseudolysinimonas kribbensis]GMA95614.1 hypothetical protein GCM10025881_24380 [Pseudolysinimonas kribbensis]